MSIIGSPVNPAAPQGDSARCNGGKPSTLLRALRPSKRVGVLLGLLSALVLLLALGPQMWVWRTRGVIHTVDDAPPVPVALVLGAAVQPSGQPSAFLEDRLEVARQLYASGKVKVLLVSGDNRTAHYDEPTAMKRWLVARGVPEEHVVDDFAGRDSYDSCVRAKKIFGVHRLIVVSQSYHLPRVMSICSALGVQAHAVGTDQGAQYAPKVWRAGELREYPANLKAAWDVLSRRRPILGQPDLRISQLLATPGNPTQR